jgi:hypothetical protein
MAAGGGGGGIPSYSTINPLLIVTNESDATKSRFVTPTYIDYDYNQLIAGSDKPFPVLDVNHLRLHEGRAFKAYRIYPSATKLADGASCNIAIAWADSVYAHILMDASCGGNAELYMYEGATVSGGTSFTAVKRNRTSATTSQSAILINPTVTVTGTEIDAEIVTGGAGKKSGGSGSGSLEIVLKPLTTYLFRLTNVSGAAQMAELFLEWYE